MHFAKANVCKTDLVKISCNLENVSWADKNKHNFFSHYSKRYTWKSAKHHIGGGNIMLLWNKLILFSAASLWVQVYYINKKQNVQET